MPKGHLKNCLFSYAEHKYAIGQRQKPCFSASLVQGYITENRCVYEAVSCLHFSQVRLNPPMTGNLAIIKTAVLAKTV